MAKDFALQARVSAEEHTAFTLIAQAVGLNVSKYLREVVRDIIKSADVDALRKAAAKRYEEQLAVFEAISNSQE